MARLRRLACPGQMHHVVLRGHADASVFVDDEDRRACLAALHDAVRTEGVSLHAYALLDHQVQLLLTPPTELALSRAMQAMGRRYGASFNRRHLRRGTLWDGRFRAGVVQSGDPALECLRLVDSLAQPQGMVDLSTASDRTSAPHRLGLRRDARLADPPEYWRLGNTPFEREAAYATLLAEGLDADRRRCIEHAAANNWALGSAEFIASVAEACGRPAGPRARGRPRRRADLP